MPIIVDDPTGGDGAGGGKIGGGGSPTPSPSPTPTPSPTPSVPPAPPPPPIPTAPNVIGSTVSSDVPLSAQAIALIAVPAQRVDTQLGRQPCTIMVYQKTTGLYLDLYVADVPIIAGALCPEGVFLVRDAYLGFTGDLIFVDTEGSDDPDYTGLGSRWSLLWLAPVT